MQNVGRHRKAISLMSGGLDSTLATRLMLDQGIEVQGLYLKSPFGCNEDVRVVAAALPVPLKIVEKGTDYIDLVRNPKYGYGKHMNPCIDCRSYMFVAAEAVRREVGADFIVTGEVLGQRPMSQRRDAMAIIDRDSHTEGLILRPLSAKLLPPSIPEREGWVDREKLLDVVGRSRTLQLKLAKTMGLTKYAAPAGGCLLTDAHFSEKLSGFFEATPDPTMGELRLLRYGRHIDLPVGGHVIIGRDEEENTALFEQSAEEVAEARMAFFQPLFPGPVAVLYARKGAPSTEEVEAVGKLIAKYSKKGGETMRRVEVRYGRSVSALTLSEDASLLPMAVSSF